MAAVCRFPSWFSEFAFPRRLPPVADYSVEEWKGILRILRKSCVLLGTKETVENNRRNELRQEMDAALRK